VDGFDATAEARQLVAESRRAEREARKQAEAEAAAQAAAAAAQQAAEAEAQAAAAEEPRRAGTRATRGNATRSRATRSGRAGTSRGEPIVSGNGNSVVDYALAQVGKNYRFAGTGPGGFDCSGLVAAAYGQAGVSLPHQTGGLSSKGQAVGRGDLRPGDLVFTDPGHVGIYVGNNQMVHASTQRGGVKRSDVYRFAYGRRIVNG